MNKAEYFSIFLFLLISYDLSVGTDSLELCFNTKYPSVEN